MFESVVVVTLQITFRAKIHQNDVFLFFYFFLFNSVFIKKTKPVFLKKPKPVQTDRFRFGYFGEKLVQPGLVRFFWFDSIFFIFFWFGFDSGFLF